MTLIIALLASAVAQAQLSSPAAAAAQPATVSPKIAFASTTFDFGRIKSGDAAKHEFVFTNLGTATLEILDVRTGCGCTTAGAWSTNVQPGKTGIIPLQFNSVGFSGHVSKSATVTCNDPGSSNVTLQIMGTIWKPVEVVPTMVMFNVSGDVQTNETKVIRITNHLEEALSLSEVKCSSPAFRTALKELRPGKEFELQVTIVPPFTNPTTYATITLKTSSTQAPMVSVNAYLTVQPAVTVMPQQIYLSPGPLPTVQNRAVTIRASGTNVLALSDAWCSAETVQVQVQETQPGRAFSLLVNFPKGYLLASGQKAEVTVKSNHPKFPLLTVPIMQPAVPVAIPRSTNVGGPLRIMPGPLMPQPARQPASSRPIGDGQ